MFKVSIVQHLLAALQLSNDAVPVLSSRAAGASIVQGYISSKVSNLCKDKVRYRLTSNAADWCKVYQHNYITWASVFLIIPCTI